MCKFYKYENISQYVLSGYSLLNWFSRLMAMVHTDFKKWVHGIIQNCHSPLNIAVYFKWMTANTDNFFHSKFLEIL